MPRDAGADKFRRVISGQWGKPGEVLLDLVVDSDGGVTGIVNPGREHASIRAGHFDAATGALRLESAHAHPNGTATPIAITGRLDGRRLQLTYAFGEQTGEVSAVRVAEYAPPPLTVRDRLLPQLAAVRRWLAARTRPTRAHSVRRLAARGESVDSIVFRDANASDIAALAELHVTTWNATYNTTRGPSVATRTKQWDAVFTEPNRRDFVLVLEDRTGRLVGFAWGRPHRGAFAGELSKIYLRWEYHGLGLGRRMMQETAQRFLARGIESFILFAEVSNPTIGFYDRMGGERLQDERALFTGAYGWRDLTKLLASSR